MYKTSRILSNTEYLVSCINDTCKWAAGTPQGCENRNLNSVALRLDAQEGWGQVTIEGRPWQSALLDCLLASKVIFSKLRGVLGVITLLHTAGNQRVCIFLQKGLQLLSGQGVVRLVQASNSGADKHPLTRLRPLHCWLYVWCKECSPTALHKI